MRRIKVSFKAHKKVSKPVNVTFRRLSGEIVTFKAHSVVHKPTRVEFYARSKKSKA